MTRQRDFFWGSVVLGLSTLCINTVQGQDPAPNSSAVVYASPWFYAQPCSGCQGYWFASTAAEGYLRGRADVIRSAGIYNLLTSQGMINVEVARRYNIDNRLHRTKTYFAMREVNERYRREHSRKHRPPKEVVAGARPPARPTTVRFDAITGAIEWPEALRSDEYSVLRREIDAMFVRGIQTNERRSLSVTHQELKRATDAVHKLLKKHVREPDQMGYVAALRFLSDLAREGRSTPRS